jgi:hypothetical protein
MTISTYSSIKNLGTKFNEVVIPPCVLPSCFYLDADGVFTIEFNGYFYRSPNYELLVEFVKEHAAKLSIFDVIPF